MLKIIHIKYKPIGEGGTRSPPATPQHLTAWFDHSFQENLKYSKLLPGGPKMAEEVCKGAYT